jgi:4-hydroxybenzoate polyprenyltransferase
VYYSRLLVVVSAGSQALLVAEILYTVLTPVLIFTSLTFGLYTFDRLADRHADAKSHPERSVFYDRYSILLWVAVVASLSFATLFALWTDVYVLAVLCISSLSVYLYTEGIGGYRIKDVFPVNTLWIGVTRGITIGLLFLTTTTAAIADVGIVAGYLTIKGSKRSEISNFKDINSDRSAGVDTLPTLLGVERAKRVIHGVTILELSYVGFVVWPQFSTTVAICLLFSSLLAGVVVFQLGRNEYENKIPSVVGKVEVLFAVVLLSLLQ